MASEGTARVLEESVLEGAVLMSFGWKTENTGMLIK